MDIETVKTARREMEQNIRTAVADAMASFHKKTGLSPESIDVRIVETTKLGDKEKSYSVVEVQASVNL